MPVIRRLLEAIQESGILFETYGRQGDCICRMEGSQFVEAVRRYRPMFRGWSTEGYLGHKVVGLFFKPEETIEFLIAMFGAIAEGFTVVPFYPNWDGRTQLEYLRQYRIRSAAVGKGLQMRVESWNEHLDRIVKVTPEHLPEATDVSRELFPEGIPDSHPCAWIFTSGTSAKVPRCTVISMRNIEAAWENLGAVDFLRPGMTLHSPLSTSHIFALVVVLGILSFKPRRILFSDVQYLARLPQERTGKIDGMILVPIVLNRLRSAFYEKLMKPASSSGPSCSGIQYRIRRKLMGLVRLAEGAVIGMESGKVDGFLKWPLVALARGVFGKTVRRRLGSPEYVVVGGAKPNLQAMAFLDVMGIRCLQGWGMTETTGPLAVCHFKDRFRGAYGTCGYLFGKTRASIDSGELVIEGPQVAEGYVEPDGAFTPFNGVKRTGDSGEFDRRGRLKILGKVSDRITLSNGLNYSPVVFEEALAAADLHREQVLEEVVVLGDGQSRLACAFFPKEGSENSSRVRDYLEGLLMEFNRTRPVDEQIGPWTLYPKPLTDTEFLGPSGKLRRCLVEEQFSYLFEAKQLEEVKS